MILQRNLHAALRKMSCFLLEEGEAGSDVGSGKKIRITTEWSGRRGVRSERIEEHYRAVREKSQMTSEQGRGVVQPENLSSVLTAILQYIISGSWQQAQVVLPR